MTTTDAWIEARIVDGQLSPGARGMTRDEAAAQHNAANALDPADADYMFTPERAQKVVHDVLRLVDLEVADYREILLTDCAAGPRAGGYAVNIGQVEAAVEQFRLVTGESLSADAITQALPWAEPTW